MFPPMKPLGEPIRNDTDLARWQMRMAANRRTLSLPAALVSLVRFARRKVNAQQPGTQPLTHATERF